MNRSPLAAALLFLLYRHRPWWRLLLALGKRAHSSRGKHRILPLASVGEAGCCLLTIIFR